MASDRPPLRVLDLPDELIYNTLSLLPASCLAVVAQTCRQLQSIALDDRLWRDCVQTNVSYTLPPQPPGSVSWRKLYIDMHPYWFIPRHKIWLSDDRYTGGLVIARYSLSRHQIEAYSLHAYQSDTEKLSPVFWDQNAEVIIAPFDPTISLDLNRPIFTISGSKLANNPSPWSTTAVSKPSIFLARHLPHDAISSSTAVWPPQTLPSISRVRNTSSDNFASRGHHPTNLADVSQHAFRMRPSEASRYSPYNVPEFVRWITLNGNNGPRVNSNAMQTFATLPPESYTPTADKPWRGIWAGDYSGHGYEFLAFLQPDVQVLLPQSAAQKLAELHLERSLGVLDSKETSGGASGRSGQLLGVKLTGDVNIPRGEYSFIMPDVGAGGTIRFAKEDMFRGARVVGGVGHIAGRGYVQGIVFLRTIYYDWMLI